MTAVAAAGRTRQTPATSNYFDPVGAAQAPHRALLRQVHTPHPRMTHRNRTNYSLMKPITAAYTVLDRDNVGIDGRDVNTCNYIPKSD